MLLANGWLRSQPLSSKLYDFRALDLFLSCLVRQLLDIFAGYHKLAAADRAPLARVFKRP